MLLAKGKNFLLKYSKLTVQDSLDTNISLTVKDAILEVYGTLDVQKNPYLNKKYLFFISSIVPKTETPVYSWINQSMCNPNAGEVSEEEKHWVHWESFMRYIFLSICYKYADKLEI